MTGSLHCTEPSSPMLFLALVPNYYCLNNSSKDFFADVMGQKTRVNSLLKGVVNETNP